jgi:hypothetical protein
MWMAISIGGVSRGERDRESPIFVHTFVCAYFIS